MTKRRVTHVNVLSFSGGSCSLELPWMQLGLSGVDLYWKDVGGGRPESVREC